MNSTSTLLGQDFAKSVVNILLNAVEEYTKQTAHFLWDILIYFLKEHWSLAILLLFVVFCLLTIKAKMGSWGSLGSFLYNLFYFGTLFIIGLIWGPEVFVDDIFKVACAIILYPICFKLVGIVLDKIKPRARY